MCVTQPHVISLEGVDLVHFGVIMTQIQKVEDGDPYKAMSHKIDNLSVTDLRFDGNQWHRGRINHCPE